MKQEAVWVAKWAGITYGQTGKYTEMRDWSGPKGGYFEPDGEETRIGCLREDVFVPAFDDFKKNC